MMPIDFTFDTHGRGRAYLWKHFMVLKIALSSKYSVQDNLRKKIKAELVSSFSNDVGP